MSRRFHTLGHELNYIISGLFLLTSIIRILTHQVLFADGSFFGFMLITTSDPYLLSNREIVMFLQQSFATLIRLSGVTKNIEYVSYGLGIGYFLIPTVVLVFCLFKSLGRPLLYLLNLSVGFLTIFMSGGMVGESSYTSILVLLFVNILITKPFGNIANSVLLFLLALILIKSYESASFLCLILGLYLWKQNRIERFVLSGIERLINVFTFFTLFAGSLLAIKNVVFPTNLANRNQAFELKFAFLQHGWIFFCLIPFIGLAITVVYSQIREHSLLKLLCYVPLILTCSFYSLATRTQIGLGFSYYTRLLSAAGVGVLLILFFISRDKVEKIVTRFQKEMAVFSLIITLIATAQSTNTAIGWHGYLNRVQQSILSTMSFAPYSTLGYSDPTDSQYSWTWSTTTLSYLLRQSENDGLLDNPGESSFKPLDPLSIPSSRGFYWQR